MAQVLKEEVQKRIKDAALAVFAEKGYPAATMNEIAARAEISTGNTYRYYPSKEALFADVLDDAFVARWSELLRERVLSLSRRASEIEPEEAYELASEELLRFTIDHRLQVVVLLGRGRAQGTKLEGFAKATIEELTRLAIQYVKASDPSFVMPETMSFTLARIYENLVDTNVAILSEHDDEGRIREAYEAFNRYHLAGMRALLLQNRAGIAQP